MTSRQSDVLRLLPYKQMKPYMLPLKRDVLKRCLRAIVNYLEQNYELHGTK